MKISSSNLSAFYRASKMRSFYYPFQRPHLHFVTIIPYFFVTDHGQKYRTLSYYAWAQFFRVRDDLFLQKHLGNILNSLVASAVEMSLLCTCTNVLDIYLPSSHVRYPISKWFCTLLTSDPYIEFCYVTDLN